MARYTLVAYDINEKWEHTSAPPLEIHLRQNGKELTKVDLFEIDALTLSFSNYNELIQSMVQRKCLPHTMFTLKIAYQHNGETKHLDVLTGDSLLYKCTLECIRLKRNKRKVELNPTSTYFKTIQNMLMKQILDTEAAPIIDANQDRLLPYPLVQDAASYRRILNRNEHGFSFEDAADMGEIKKHIAYILQKYKNIRGIRIWQKAYENGELKKYYRPNYVKTPAKPVSNILIFTNPKIEANPYMDTDGEFLDEKEIRSMAGNEPESVYTKFK